MGSREAAAEEEEEKGLGLVEKRWGYFGVLAAAEEWAQSGEGEGEGEGEGHNSHPIRTQFSSSDCAAILEG